ncbi:MAG: zinc transport system substrate-binding protein [Oleiphilaceae bacterium]|jgi:zinc transport system substrate-binding protein
MYQKILVSALLSFGVPISAFSAQLASPLVVVDIAPLHSLVSQVMEGVGKPDLLIPAEASPHQYSLLPSQVKSLSNAAVVFWMSESLTPWLEKTLDNVASSAQKIEMLNLEGTITHEFREGATFESHEKHDVADNEDHHDDNDHHSDHDGKDPHAWLDPQNAKFWINSIRHTLSSQDPANAQIYKQNAEQASASIDALIKSSQEAIGNLGELNFIVFHDAYQYFEKRFNLSAAGAISLGDAEDPSPARIEKIRDTIKILGINCVFTEPQYNLGLVNSVFEGTNISSVAIMDPLGASIPEGKDHYQNLIQGMLNSLKQCKQSVST